MGIQMHLSMDGISALMVLLAAVLMPIIVYATDTSKFTSQHTLFALMMAMQGAMLGAFTAMDGFVFYIILGTLFIANFLYDALVGWRK